nr:PREDICTED: ankyrin repeat and MYND domain-containing protein 1 isoform X2 [Latimeria chalumnae]|eukprot:XP_014354205.1 PREDICTED: ankyrin repeat and MYND domain-containing protein 1 isoform X2 [Latimeria chalumnae]
MVMVMMMMEEEEVDPKGSLRVQSKEQMDPKESLKAQSKVEMDPKESLRAQRKEEMDPKGSLRVLSKEKMDPKGSLMVLSKVEEVDPKGCLRFSGIIVNDKKQGYGVQEWPNGSRYEGNFAHDLKHGYGEFAWANGEVYKGQFYKDHCHGDGIYTWPDGTRFVGTFYLDQKEGYGTLELKDGKIFQGLYKADVRFGPGILTYADGTQDVGLWHREHLIKLCTEFRGFFSIKNFPRYRSWPQDEQVKIILTEERRTPWQQGEENDPFFYNYKRLLLQDKFTLPEKIQAYSNNTEHLPLTRTFWEDFDREFFQEHEELMEETEGEADPVAEAPLLCENVSPLLVEMRKHVYKHRSREQKLNWDVTSLLLCKRDRFAPKGPMELVSQRLIEAALKGNYQVVYEVLRDGLAQVDVADRSGCNSLLAATINCHLKIISLLLDSGADVNRRTDEGISALTACHMLYYSSFKPNIAEKNLAKMEFQNCNIQDSSNLPKEYCYVSVCPVNLPEEYCYWGSLGEPSPVRDKVPPTTSVINNESSAEQQKEELQMDSGVETDVECKLPKEDVEMVDFGATEDEANRENPLETDGCETNAVCDEQANVEPDQKMETEATEAASINISDGVGDSSSNLKSPSQCHVHDAMSDSDASVLNFAIKVSQKAVQRSAEFLSHTDRMKANWLSGGTASLEDQGRLSKMAKLELENRLRKATMNLLLQRGADPNVSCVPMQCLFFAVKAADSPAVKLLLEKGARTDIRLSVRLGGLTPLHIAAALPGRQGVMITEMLLHAAADPDVKAADEDDIYQPDKAQYSATVSGFPARSSNPFGPPPSYYIIPELKPEEGGRTPLHVACERDTDYKYARDVVRLLISHRANVNFLWSGHTPLSLAIASGNELAVEELLWKDSELNLPLTKGIGSVLCTAVNISYPQMSAQVRNLLVDKLIRAGASILQPITIVIGKKALIGTAVDFAYYKFYQDKRIAHTPYHALLSGERVVYNARKELLSHLGFLLRQAAVKKEKERVERELEQASRSKQTSSLSYSSKSTSCKFLYTATPLHHPRASAKEHKQSSSTSRENRSRERASNMSSRMSTASTISRTSRRQSRKSKEEEARLRLIRKPLFKYCYQCGRSIGVHLTPCTRCQEVYYCNKSCKVKAWNDCHKFECVRLEGPVPASRKPSPPAKKGHRVSPLKYRPGTVDNKLQACLSKILGHKGSHEDEELHDYTENYSFN